MKKQYEIRILVLSVFFVLMGVAIIGQMIRIQTSDLAEDFVRQRALYQGEYRTYYPARGEIYDRSGNLLAGNKTVYEIGAQISSVRDPQTVALTLSTHLGIDYNRTLQALTDPAPGQIYTVLARFVPAEKARELQRVKEQLQEDYRGEGSPTLAGLDFNQQLQRTYPENDLASNLLGFVTLEGRGYYGLEEKYNNVLAGEAVTVWVPSDPNRARELPSVPNGSTLILTLDRELQAAIEQTLDRALRETGAKNGTIVVMNPRNGEILAMTSSPRMNLNEFWRYSEIYKTASEFNRAVAMQYEPGSVFKILTLAAGLESGTVHANSSYLDTGFYRIGGAYLYNWDQGAWGPQNILGCMQHSLNVCLVWIADSMGPQTFYSYMSRFGIGQPTGIDLAGEARGRLKIPGDADWYAVDLGTNSFGQGVAVTPIQMLAAASAFANDGQMVVPHLVYAMVTDGYQYTVPIQESGRPISPQVARITTEILAQAMERGDSLGLVPGYRVAGKTGTAQIPTETGRYSPTETNASFIGWGPVDDPQFMVYIWLEKPESSSWASEVAAPVFKDVVEQLVVLLEIPPDALRQRLAGQ
jgi:cell division protein FtsI/penicillin-binding protein 2